MTYLVAVVLPDELRRQIERLQAQFQSSKWKITLPPHITFLYYADCKNEESFIDALRAVTGQTPPFSIGLKGIGQFNRRDICIYGAVQKTPEVMRFHEHLHTAAQISVNQLFTPHITLSNRLTRVQAPAIYAALKRKGPSESFLATGCSLYRRGESQRGWEHIVNFPFSSASTNRKKTE